MVNIGVIKFVGENQRKRTKSLAFIEKRRHPRLRKSLPLKIRKAEFDIFTETKNISASGAYCSIDRYLAPYTKLAIQLFLPSKRKTEQIDCKGVIVRTEENLNNTYNIAIYFNEIKKSAQRKISRYVDYNLKREKT